MTTRILLTVLLLLALFAGGSVFRAVQGPIEGRLAVKQLEDNDASYILGRAASQNDFLLKMFQYAVGGLVVLIWLPTGVRFLKGKFMDKAALLVVCGILAGVAAGCTPYKTEQFVEIKSNETAFVIPLEGATKDAQGKFDSVQFLEEKKVASKRITIPLRDRSLGRMYWDLEYIPTVRVITVDRSPVSRHWTPEKSTGTTEKNEALHVESLDSIGFFLGINVTAAIEEQDTAVYLYNFPTGKLLSEVIDNEIKAFVQQILAREFGKRTLTICKVEKADIFLKAFDEVRDYFKKFGITVRTLGHFGGLTYENPEIQIAIDRAYKTEMDIQTAKMEAQAQAERNKKDVSREEAIKQMAEIFQQAKEAQQTKIMLEIQRMSAEARLEMSKKWNGQLPQSILPQGSNLLLGLDSPAATPQTK